MPKRVHNSLMDIPLNQQLDLPESMAHYGDVLAQLPSENYFTYMESLLGHLPQVIEPLRNMKRLRDALIAAQVPQDTRAIMQGMDNALTRDVLAAGDYDADPSFAMRAREQGRMMEGADMEALRRLQSFISALNVLYGRKP